MDLNELFDKSLEKYGAVGDGESSGDLTFVFRKEDTITETKSDAVATNDLRLQRTVFINNVPVSVIKDRNVFKSFKKLLGEEVESLRFRSIALSTPCSKNETRKAAVIKGNFHPERDSMNAYVVYKSKEHAEEVIEKLNGNEFEGKHLFFDFAVEDKERLAMEKKRTVFIGSLSFTVTEEEIFQYFQQCGHICRIRLIRDSSTGLGKGFGYVVFSDRAAASLALQLNGTTCCNRTIRVTKCSTTTKIASKNNLSSSSTKPKSKTSLARKSPSFAEQLRKKKLAHKKNKNL